MMSILRESKNAIRYFIRAHWDDQRLHDVYAFNRDGRMKFIYPCCCLLGVTQAAVLHERCDGLSHYLPAKELPGAEEAELAYGRLRCFGFPVGLKLSVEHMDALLQRRLSAILRAEMRRRNAPP